MGRLPEIDTEAESIIVNDEIWDEGAAAANDNNPFNEPMYDKINMISSSSVRG